MHPNVVSCDKNHSIDITQVWAEVWELYLNGEKWWFEHSDNISETILNHQRAAVDYDPIIESLIFWNGGDFSAEQSDYSYAEKYTVPSLVYLAKGQNPLDKNLQRPTGKEIKKVRDFLIERGIFSAKYDGYFCFKLATKNQIIDCEARKNSFDPEICVF